MARTTAKTKAAEATLVTEERVAQLPAAQGQGAPPAPVTSDPLFSLIERASRDKDVDIDKMERLIAMHAGVKKANAQQDYDSAMSEAQAEMKTIRTNLDNSQTKSKYASYSALDKAIRPIYTKHGFALSFNTGDAIHPDEVRLLCTVSHRGGHRQEYKLDMPADGKGARGGDVMTKTHATGAAVTYGKRYLAGMIFNLSVGSDDDGNAAGDRYKAWTDAKIQELNTGKWDQVSLDKFFDDNEVSITALRKKAPEEFERYHTAFMNAAKSAGYTPKEPVRENYKEPSTGGKGADKKARSRKDKAEMGTATGGQTDASAASAAGDAASATASGQPAVTDVVDQNEKPPAKDEDIEFEDFTTTRPFLDFSSGWLAEPGRTPEAAKRWEAHYREKMKTLKTNPPKDKDGKEIAWVQEGIADLLVQYNLIVGIEG